MGSSRKQGNRRRQFLIFSVLLSGSFCLYIQLIRLGYAVPLPYLLHVFCWNNCSDNLSSNHLHSKVPGNGLLNYRSDLTQLVDSPEIDKNKVSILIEKSRYRLTVYYDKKPLKSYPVVLGFNSVDDKLKEGDGSTPEGIFKIKDLYTHPTWSKFLWLDYPTKDSWRKHIKAKGNGKINWLDSIGGQVGIHGVPDEQDFLIEKRSNWTLGCISLKNRDIEELYQVVKQGTEVEIIQ